MVYKSFELLEGERPGWEVAVSEYLDDRRKKNQHNLGIEQCAFLASGPAIGEAFE